MHPKEHVGLCVKQLLYLLSVTPLVAPVKMTIAVVRWAVNMVATDT
jgi:hypothetical protein